jgi:2-polyprenyl-6-methoxyphenol hydroxylase-like FAD-dependent oxidoreductase
MGSGDLVTNIAVLIVGGGPTGLVLALSLVRRGIPVRIISEAEGPGEHSRAMVVQARTLEFYDQFGFADEVVRQGIPAGMAHLREGGNNGRGREVVAVSFHDLGEGLSPFPFPLAYPQDDHERFLIAKLRELGCHIDWRCRLIGFSSEVNQIRASVLRNQHQEEIETIEYLCGCDGAHSCVRETLNVGFPGGTYDQLFYVADVQISTGFNRDLYLNLGVNNLTLMFPVRSSGMQRLIGLVPPELSQVENLHFEDIRSQVEPLLNIRVTAIHWFSTYRVHHRVAEHFRIGRAFLLGDAAHIHSPVGGQGMNTGIGDAVNLGWKLAEVLQERASPELLDSYEPERIGFAQALVSTTDRAFTPLVAGGIQGEFTRRILAPFFMTIATRFALSKRAMFRLVSQIQIHYSKSFLSEGKAGDVEGGDRLPWIRMATTDNFASLRSLDWQVHVYGNVNHSFTAECNGFGLPLHVFPWTESAKKAGLQQGAAYLIRPDGHVALASSKQDAGKLRSFVNRLGLRFPALPLAS